MSTRYDERIEGVFRGPLITVSVGLPIGYDHVLERLNMPIPPRITMTGIIDTGASTTAIRDSDALRLQLPEIEEVAMYTAGTNRQIVRMLYQASLTFPNGPTFDRLYVIGAPLDGPVQCLIGRDILANAIFHYDGLNSIYSLEFPNS